MDKIGIFVCVRESDIENIPHIINELSKQKAIGFTIQIHLIIHTKNPKFKLINSNHNVVYFVSNDLGKLYVFKFIQEKYKNYKYYLFSDCDIFLSKDCIIHMYNLLKNTSYEYTSARSQPITYVHKKLTTLDKLNISKIENDATIMKIKPYGAFILFKKSFFINVIKFNKINKINEDRWIFTKHPLEFIPCFNAFFFYLLPNTIKDRIHQQSRISLGRLLITGNEFNKLKVFDNILNTLVKFYVCILYFYKKIGLNYWKIIESTKPNKNKNLYYSKKFENLFKTINIQCNKNNLKK